MLLPEYCLQTRRGCEFEFEAAPVSGASWDAHSRDSELALLTRTLDRGVVAIEAESLRLPPAVPSALFGLAAFAKGVPREETDSWALYSGDMLIYSSAG